MGQPHDWVSLIVGMAQCKTLRCGKSSEMASLLEHVNARIDDLHISRQLWAHAQEMEEMIHLLMVYCIEWQARLTLWMETADHAEACPPW